MARPKTKLERRLLRRQKLESLYDRGGNGTYITQVCFFVRTEKGRNAVWKRPEGEAYGIARVDQLNRKGRCSFVRAAKKRSRRKVRHTWGKFCHGAYRKVYDLRSALN